MIDERIAERRAEVRDERRRGRLRRTLVTLALLAVVVALVLVERSALVGLEEVRVVGTDRLDVDTVLDAADLELGTSTLRLGLNDATDRVTALPAVRDARASRLDPLTVEIVVEERQPVLTATGGGETRLLDRDGVVLAEADHDALPRIELPGEPPPVGAHVDTDPTLANAHETWQHLSGPLRAEVSRYEATGPDELSLQLARGIEVRFGRAHRVDEKVRALGAILTDLETDDGSSDDVAVIDVRAPGAPVVVGR